MGEVKKSSFYCFARQRRPQWAHALKAKWPTLEGVVRSFIVFREQDVVISWPVLGLAGIKVKFQASTAFWFQPVQGLCPCGQRFSSGQWVFFSSGVRGGLLPVKTETTYECVSGFIYVFQRTGSSVTLTI